ncbi:MAG: hypothetical protein N2111_12750 [Candidatus Sumerlaeaceae bacterium]|nr:hypothetical protein [Candidatus Sumerlaeaceae bacterium]
MTLKQTFQRLTVFAVALAASAAFAQPFYIRGDNPPLDGFPACTIEIYDNGTNGDDVAGDGIWKRDFTVVTPSSQPANRFNWKVAECDWSPEFPAAFDNSMGVADTAGATIKFVLETAAKNDGYLPDVGVAGQTGILYTVPSPITLTDVMRITGDFQSELGGSDWDASALNTIVKDDGLAPDATAGDNIYTVGFTGLPANTYQFLVTVNGGYDKMIKTRGFSAGSGGNFTFTVLSPTDNVKFEVNRLTGRVKISNDNPLLNPGPPFYALSQGWSTVLGPATQLYDDGTNGDVTSGDGIHSRSFLVTNGADPGTTRALKIAQGVGPQYPGSGSVSSDEGYPYSVTTGTTILVQFDTNTYTDGYLPNTRFCWVNPAARVQFDTTVYTGNPSNAPAGSQFVQAVGNLVNLGGLTEGWADNSATFQLLDNGVSNDGPAGNGVFGGSFSNPLGVNGENFKVIGGPVGNRYLIQMGGAGEGLNKGGNPANQALPNIPAGTNVVWVVDAVLGRTAVNPSGQPTRPATFNAGAGAGVGDWSIY